MTATTTTQATINRVTDKAGKFLGYAIKSDSSDAYYYITWDNARSEYSCPCPATKLCKHISAVNEVIKAANAVEKSISATYEQGQKVLERSQAKATTPKSTVAPLNGNRPFSLMR